jgi:hypothetical protein
VLDSLMLLFRRTPFRCRRCERRFYSALNRSQDGPKTVSRAVNQKAG